MRIIIAALVAITLSACGGSLPKNVLAEEKFREVMWDLTRGAEFVNNFKNYNDTVGQKAADQVMYRDKILALHKVTLEQFTTSYAYYRARPEQMRVILDSLSKKPQAKNIDTVVSKKDSVALDTVKIDSAVRKPLSMDSMRKRVGGLRAIRDRK